MNENDFPTEGANPGDPDYLTDEEWPKHWRQLQIRLWLRRIRRWTLPVLAVILISLGACAVCHRQEGDCRRFLGTDPHLTYVCAANVMNDSIGLSQWAGSPWRPRAWAAGRDCRVLLIHVETAFTPEWADRWHYGETLIPGSVHRYATKYGFRGTIYLDKYGRKWAYPQEVVDEVGTRPYGCR